MDYKKIAQELCEAEKRRQVIKTLTETYPDMNLEDAYAIQLENVRRRKANGEHVIGMKIGLTSEGMQTLLNVHEPDYGHLFDTMLLLERDNCSMSKLIQPKVEGELSFCLKKTLKGPGITVADVYDATAWVTPSIEIVDSRIKDWKIKLEDTVADNASAAFFKIGGRMTKIENIDMRLTGMTIEKNGALVGSGTTAEVWGNPAASVAWLANKLSQFDIALEADQIVMAGAVTASPIASLGDIFTVSFCNMGSVSVKFVE
jgi:2-keto-4-pentenoate hydratase